MGYSYANVHGIELSRAQVVHDFVGSEEAQRVGEVLEVLDDAEDTCEIFCVVARPWRSTIDALSSQRRIDVKDHVDAGRVEDGGACRMVELRVDIVDADRVDLALSV